MRPSSMAVIGLGAIGGSLAWQARMAGIPKVVGFSPSRSDGIEALRASAITDLADSAVRATRGAELVVLAVPPNATLDLIGRLASELEAAALMTDVCSVKAPIVARAAAEGLGDRFAGGHPLAGTHASGFAAARPDRLRGCVVYVCETGAPGGDQAARNVMSFWRRVLEASPVLIDATAHDRQLAWTSHLPQAVASALAKILADRGLSGVSFGPGARDTTRLAASQPDMWIDILLHNREAVADALAAAETGLADLRRLIATGDAAGLRQYLTTAQRFREGLER
ncbi:MAG TPA: prephenate dehydrogenase/arogenate dehydrogenase family protein [Gemmatimonadales bacterium]|nr:prephenate dehydrogenase/arogenate dehydrogenase family protein [Gemmatimonadales bacterium]